VVLPSAVDQYGLATIVSALMLALHRRVKPVGVTWQ